MSDTQPIAYGFDQETPEQLGTTPIPGGINENVKLVDIAYEPAKEGSENMCLSFYFQDKEGRQLRHAEFPVDPEETKKRAIQQGNDPVDAVRKRVRAQGVRLKHIATKIVSEERAVIKNVQTFQQYAQAVIQLLKPELPAGPFRIKVIMNHKDYSSLPPYPPFIERQTDEATKLKIDKRERTQPATAANPAGLDMPAGGPGDDFGDEEAPF